MSLEQPDPAALESAHAALVDPDLREWPAPSGVLSEPAGLRASFTALRMRAVVAEERGEILFEAWKNPRATGAILAALLAAVVYLALDRLGVSEFRSIVAIVLVAWYVPTWLLPSYRVSGRIGGGAVRFRVEARGLFARRERVEEGLRFYLLRPGTSGSR